MWWTCYKPFYRRVFPFQKPDIIHDRGCAKRHMFERYTSDDTVATILAGVSNEVGWLMHELDDPDNDEELVSTYRSLFDSWYALERDLVAEVIRRLEEENQTTGTKYLTTGIGTHYIIKPFMERNGFIDGAGWWIKEHEE